MFFPQQPGDRLDLANFLVGDGVVSPSVAAIEQGLCGFLWERGNHPIQNLKFVLRACQQPRATNQQAHGSLPHLVVFVLTAHHPPKLSGDFGIFLGLVVREGNDVGMVAIRTKPPIGNGTS